MNPATLIGRKVYPDNVNDNVRTARRLDVQGQTMLKQTFGVAEAVEMLALVRPANLKHLTQ